MSRTRGPRSTRSPTKTAFRPSGMAIDRARRRARSPSRRSTDLVAERREQRLQLVAAAVDVADDVERAVFVLLLFQSGSRSISTPSTSSGFEDADVAEALAAEARASA